MEGGWGGEGGRLWFWGGAPSNMSRVGGREGESGGGMESWEEGRGVDARLSQCFIIDFR